MRNSEAAARRLAEVRLAEGLEIGRLDGHTGPVTAVVFLPDGSTALAGGEDGKLILWDVKEGGQPQTLAGHTGAVRSVTVSRDGRLVA